MHPTCGVHACLERRAPFVLFFVAVLGGCGGETTEPTFNPLTIVTTSIADAYAGVPYLGQVNAFGGDGNYTWEMASGALPSGLVLDASDAQIMGIPASTGTANFTVLVTSGDGQTATRSFTLTVDEPLHITTMSLPDGREGEDYGLTVMADGGGSAFTWSVADAYLPTGLTLVPDSGLLYGVPTMPGPWTFTLRATNLEGQSDEVEYTITIVGELVIASTFLPSGVVGVPYPAFSLEASGGQGYTWSIVAGALPDGLFLDPSSGVVSGTPTTAADLTFTIQLDTGDGQTATKEIAAVIYEPLSITTSSLPDAVVDELYDQSLTAVGGDGANTWTKITGGFPTGVTLDPSSGQISGTPTTAGETAFHLRVQSGDGQSAEVDLTISVRGVLAITTTELSNAVEGEAYSATVAAVGGDGNFTWSLAADTLPTGLSLDPSTGEISGTPTTTGAATFTLQVDSDGLTEQVVLSMWIYQLLEITTGSVADAFQGVAYDETVAAIGGNGNHTWSVSGGALPMGLAVGPSTGTISGSPADVESASFTLQVESGDGQIADAGFSIDVSQLLLQADELCTIDTPGAVGTFADGILEIAVRQALGVSGSTTLTCELLRTLTTLQSTSLGLTDLTGLQNLEGLVDANLSLNSISDLSPLAGLTSLVDLQLVSNSITDVSPLSGLTGIGFLHLGDNHVSDISALSGMTQMWRLDLDDNSVSDISAVAGMTNLEILSFQNNSVTSLGPVSGLTKLEILTANGNSIADVTALAGLTAMRNLSLSGNAAISDVSAVAGMGDLAWLQLGSTSVTDLSPLSGLTSLAQLWLESTSISSLSPLSGLTALEFLAAGFNVTDLTGLDGLTSLSDLRLGANNALADIQPLLDNTGLSSGDAVRLTATNVPCSQVFALEAKGVNVATECLTPLELCNGDGNAIATFEDAIVEAAARSELGMNATDVIRCQHLSTMTTLDVASAGVASLAGLQNAVGLTELDASSNGLSEVSWLLQLSALQNLYLQHNSITDITAFEVLTNLTDLRLDDNPSLADIGPLIVNTGVGSGDTVDLTGTLVLCTDVDTLRGEGATVVAPTCP